MDYTTFDSSKNLTEDDFQECLNEKRIRQDIENLTVEEFISALLDTIDKDTTVDMIEDNLLRAIRMIQDYKTNRIERILFMKRSWDFIEDQKREDQRKKNETEIKVKS